MAAHVHLTYDSSLASATAEIVADHRDGVGLTYSFGGVDQSSNTKKFSSTSDLGPVQISVKGADGSVIKLDDIDFFWNAPAVHPKEESTGDYRSGQKVVYNFDLFCHSNDLKNASVL